MFSVTYLVYEKKGYLWLFKKKNILLKCLLKAYYPKNKNKFKKAFILEKDIGMEFSRVDLHIPYAFKTKSHKIFLYSYSTICCEYIPLILH